MIDHHGLGCPGERSGELCGRPGLGSQLTIPGDFGKIETPDDVVPAAALALGCVTCNCMRVERASICSCRRCSWRSFFVCRRQPVLPVRPTTLLSVTPCSANGSASSVVDVYDAGTGTWSASAINLSVPRYYLASASSEPLVIFAGGACVAVSVSVVKHSCSDLGGRVYDVVDIFNVNTRAWSSTSTGAGRLGSKRNYLAGAALNGYFMFGGGRYALTRDTCPEKFCSTVSSPSADVDLYVGATGSWEYHPSALSEPRSSLAAAAAANRIVFSGGMCGKRKIAALACSHLHAVEAAYLLQLLMCTLSDVVEHIFLSFSRQSLPHSNGLRRHHSDRRRGVRTFR